MLHLFVINVNRFVYFKKYVFIYLLASTVAATSVITYLLPVKILSLKNLPLYSTSSLLPKFG
jgi:hypothetical protein